MKNFIILSMSLMMLMVLSSCNDSGGSGSNRNVQFFITFDTPEDKTSELIGVSSAGTPSEMTLTLEKVWISKHSDCSEPTFLASFLTSTLTTQTESRKKIILDTKLAVGEYNCLIIRSSDTYKFVTPKTIADPGTHSGCQANTSYGMDLYRTGAPNFYDYYTDSTITSSGTLIGANTYPQTETPYAGKQDITYFYTTGGESEIIHAYNYVHPDQVKTMDNSIVVEAGKITNVILTYKVHDLLRGNQTDGADPLCLIDGLQLGIDSAFE